MLKYLRYNIILIDVSLNARMCSVGNPYDIIALSKIIRGAAA